jgi:hypothetical protein
MEGLNRVVKDAKHRKEVVAGGLDEFLTAGVCGIPFGDGEASLTDPQNIVA